MKNFVRVFVDCLFLSVLMLFEAHAHSTRVSYAADVFFKLDSSVVDDSHEKLKDFSVKGAYIETEAILVIGHADKYESDPKKLSEQRALSVKEFLMQQSVNPRKIYVEGVGVSQPIAPIGITSNAKQLANGRVELELVGTNQNKHAALFGWGHSSGRFEIGLHRPTSREPIYLLDDQLTAVSPLIFAKQIKNPEEREKYFNTIVLTALDEKRIEQVALYAPELKNCRQIPVRSNPVKFATPNPYLYALAFLDVQYVNLLKHCEPLYEDTRQSIGNLVYAKFCLSRKTSSLKEISAWAIRLGWNGEKFEFQTLNARDIYQCALNTPESIGWFVNQGLDLDMRHSPSHNLPLHLAVELDSFFALSVLLQAGANPNASNPDTGRTALHLVNNSRPCTSWNCSQLSKQDKQKFWDLLIQHGADPTVVNIKGERPALP